MVLLSHKNNIISSCISVSYFIIVLLFVKMFIKIDHHFNLIILIKFYICDKDNVILTIINLLPLINAKISVMISMFELSLNM